MIVAIANLTIGRKDFLIFLVTNNAPIKMKIEERTDMTRYVRNSYTPINSNLGSRLINLARTVPIIKSHNNKDSNNLKLFD